MYGCSAANTIALTTILTANVVGRIGAAAGARAGR